MNAFDVLLGVEEGSVLRAALRLVNTIPLDDLKKAIEKLDRVETVGPLFDPSAWTDGEKGARSIFIKRIVRHVIEVREDCERFKEWEEKKRRLHEERRSGRNS